jgi:hypothetical protein
MSRRAPFAIALVLLLAATGLSACGGDGGGKKKTYRTSADAKPFGGPAPLRIEFTATAKNPSGDVNYLWRFDDGTTSTEQNPDHIFTRPGYYQVSVDIRDKKHERQRQNLLVGAWPPKIWARAFARQGPPSPAEARKLIREQQKRTDKRHKELERQHKPLGSSGAGGGATGASGASGASG